MSKYHLLLGLGIYIGLIGCSATSDQHSAKSHKQDVAKQGEGDRKSESNQLKEAKFPFVVDNFEGAHLKKWRKQDSGNMKSAIEFSNDAKEGKKSAKVSFTGSKEDSSWLDLFYDIGVGNWPKGGNVITFWAKAPKECKVLLKINQGAQHEEWEFYGSKELTIGTEWKKYSLNIKDTANLIWGHLEPPSGRIIPETVYGIGFDAVDFPVEFLVDQFQIESEKK